LGSFHLLMQQRELANRVPCSAGYPVAKLDDSFANVAPEILTLTHSQTFRASEHSCTLQIQDYLLTVIYDLLIADNRQAQI